MSDIPPALAAALHDRYALERPLGRGGMATVYLARDLRHARPVALKVLRPDLAATLGPDRFRREVQTAARLQHPHICTVYDSGESAGLLWYTMPYVRGESLRDRLDREGRLPLGEALRIVTEAGRALDYAHREGFVHRDIKPENILITAEGDGIVADFGIARALAVSESAGQRGGGAERLTETGISLGTPAYMAPEQATAERDIGPPADQYALAVTCWELLAGAPPFTGATAAAIVAQRFTGPVPSIRAARPELPPALDQVLRRALALAPAERFESTGAFVRALNEAAAAGARSSAAGPADPRASTAAAPTAPSRFRRRSAALALAALALVPALLLLRSGPPWDGAGGVGAAPDPRLVAVFPFTVRADTGLAYLGEGMVDLLSTGLEGAGDLRSVDPRTVLRVGHGNVHENPEAARAAARRMGAGRFVLGTLFEVGGRIRATAALYDETGERRSVAEATAADESGLLQLVDGLTQQLIAAQLEAGGRARASAEAMTTGSLPALKAYLAGQREFRQGRYEAAVQAFERAVASDTAFALAEHGLAQAARWSLSDPGARGMAERALRHAASLGGRDRRRLEAFVASARGQADSAESLYRTLVSLEPDDPGAWFGLGDVLFQLNPRRGRPRTESREPLERALALEPGSISVRLQLAYLAAGARDYRAHDSLLAPLTRSADFAPFIRAVRVFAEGAPAERESLLAELRRGPEGPLLSTAGYVALLSHNLPGAIEVAGLLTEPSRPARTRARAHVVLAKLALARGRWREARAELARAADDSVAALESLALWSLLPPLATPAAELDGLRRRLARPSLADPPPPGPDAPPLARDTARPGLHAYLVGLLAGRLGDSAAAERAADALEQSAGSGEHGAACRRLASGVRAELALALGDSAGAMARLEGMRIEEPAGYLGRTPFYAAAYERFRLGQLLRRAGRGDEAVRWLAQLGATSDELVYVAPAELELAGIADAAGRAAEAAEHRRRAAELWRDADPELRALLTR